MVRHKILSTVVVLCLLYLGALHAGAQSRLTITGYNRQLRAAFQQTYRDLVSQNRESDARALNIVYRQALLSNYDPSSNLTACLVDRLRKMEGRRQSLYRFASAGFNQRRPMHDVVYGLVLAERLRLTDNMLLQALQQANSGRTTLSFTIPPFLCVEANKLTDQVIAMQNAKAQSAVSNGPSTGFNGIMPSRGQSDFLTQRQNDALAQQYYERNRAEAAANDRWLQKEKADRFVDSFRNPYRDP